MIKNSADPAALEQMELRLKTILPEEYQDSYEDVQPVSMGSAGLKFGSDGKVAWDDMWDTFCDLAMAGGPPHKGRLLEPGSVDDIHAQPDRYRKVVEELCRGIRLVADLPVQPSPVPGWVRLECESPGMAGWLLRAVLMENISARSEEAFLDLPAGPDYRVEKEIKNVITAIAKTCHYYADHMWASQQRTIGELLEKMESESPLVQPSPVSNVFAAGRISELVSEQTTVRASGHRYAGWWGLECPSVRAAVWMMRALVASNVLARREETTLFVPLNPATDPNGDVVAQAVIQVYGFAEMRGVLN